MKEIERRLLRLEEAAKRAAAVREAHAPFVEFIPWSITLDLARLEYRPAGVYSHPVVLEYVSIMDGLNLALEASRGGLFAWVWMDSCAEWIHTLHVRRRGGLYTPEQVARTRERDIRELGGVKQLLESEDCTEIMDILESLPQGFPI